MVKFFNGLPELFQIYLVIGAIVFLVVWKSFAYRLANRASGHVSGHRVSSFKDMGIDPTFLDYLFSLGWVAPMVMGWPIVLFVFITGTNHPKDKK